MGLLNNKDDEKKPLFRVWAKKNPGKNDFVKSIKLSASEEWIIIEGIHSVALLNAESKVGQAFWSQVQEFNGKALGLNITPAKGKLGFDLEPTKPTGYWEWDGERLCEFLNKRTTTSEGKMSSASLWRLMSSPEADNFEGENRAGLKSVKSKARSGKEQLEEVAIALEEEPSEG